MRLVTAKPQPYARTILQHFGIDTFFEGVHGPSLEDRTHNNHASCLGPADTVMLGDRVRQEAASAFMAQFVPVEIDLPRLPAGAQVTGWRTSEMHTALLAFGLTRKPYSLTQLRDDLRK